MLVGCFNVGDLMGKSPPRSNPSPSPNPDPNSNPNPNPNPKPNTNQARLSELKRDSTPKVYSLPLTLPLALPLPLTG